jgi:hypothetical protein
MALNPIIEAFLAAREQASRDFAQDQNRVLAREQMSEEAKRQQELFKQQQELQRVNLAAEKAMRDAEYKLRESQLKEETIRGNRDASLRGREQIIKDVASGLVSPTTTVLTGGQNVQVGQPGGMDQALTQIPQAPQGFDPNINLETGMFNQLGMPTVQDFNTAPWEGLLPGGDEQTREILKSVTPYETIHQRKLDDLEIMKALELRAALEKEQGIFDIREPSKKADRLSRAEIASNRDKNALEVARIRANATLSAAAIRASKKAAAEGVTIDPQAMGGFIDGSYNLDDFVKQFATAKERTAAATAFRSEGFKFLAKPEQKLLDRAGIIAETARNAQELANLYKDGYVKNFSKIRAKNAAIESVLGNLARGVSGEAGVLTQADIERIKGIVPSFTGSMIGKMNQDQVNQLNKYVKNTFGHVFYNMRDDQAQTIVNKYGLNNSGIYSSPKNVKISPDQLKEWTK